MTGYVFPSTVEEALRLLAEYDGRALVIAGGTDVLPDIGKGKHAPACLVDITRIPELNRIEASEDCIKVGAAVPFVTLAEHPGIASRVHALVDAAASVGVLAIQTAATWVGNLIQSMPAADGAIIAVALDAEACVRDASNGRTAAWRPVASLFTGPGRSRIDPARQLVTHIRFAVPGGRWGTAWRRTGRRPSLVLPTLNCAAKIVLDDDGRIASAAIAMGPVGLYPMRATEAEASLTGRKVSPALLAEAAELALCDADPRSSVLRASREYRLAVLPVLVEEALTQAARRAGEPGWWPSHRVEFG